MSERWNEHLAPRSPYEAIDFGFQFARAHYLRLVALAATILVPAAVVFPFVNPWGAVGASLLVYWTKPLWERPMLVYLSRALFDEPPARRAIFADWKSWAFRDLPAFLLWRRLSPTRSFDLPVTLLEGTRGADRAARIGVLHRGRFPGAAASLTIVLVHVEAFLGLGLVGLIAIAVPESAGFDFFAWFFDFDGEAESSAASEALGYVTTVISCLAIAPFYVASGFALYLHRRTELEAWDLEVAFRRLAERAAERRRRMRVGATAVVATLALSIGLGASMAARAIETPAVDDGAVLSEVVGLPNVAELAPVGVHEREGARAAIEEVLAGSDFHAFETISIPKFLYDLEFDEEDDDSEGLPEWFVDLLEGFATFVASSIEVIVVALLVLALGWIMLRFVASTTLEGFADRLGGARRVAVPRELFGMEITEESLPDDLVDEAMALARAGRVREALALLYRGALSRLVLHRGADLSRGVTERECLAIAAPLLPEEGTRYFGALTTTWLRCAYGHLDPEPGALEGLCRDWTGVFDVVQGDEGDAEGAS